MSYVEYIQFMSNYRCVFQLDQSMVPGQVAGDCSLTRQVCLGGNGAIDNILFPDLICNNRSELIKKLKLLMTDQAYYDQINNKSNTIAMEKISFSSVAKELHAFYMSI